MELDLDLEKVRARIKANQAKSEESDIYSAAGAFAEGAKKGVLGPLRDLGNAHMPPEYFQFNEEQAKQHAAMDLAGNLGGFIGSAMTGTGLGSVITGVGKVGAKIGGRIAGKAGARLAGSTAEGIGISLSEATGKSVVDRSMGVPGAGIELADAAGTGAAWGAGFGLASVVMPGVANFLFKKTFSKRIAAAAEANAKRTKAGAEYNTLAKEYEALLSETAPSIRNTFRMGELAGHAGKRTHGNVTLPSGAKAGYAEKSLLSEAQQKIWKHDKRINRTLEGALKDTAESTRYGMKDMLVDATLLASAGPEMVVLRRLAAPALAGMQKQVFAGLTGLKPIRALMSSSLQAGKLSSRKMVRQGTELVHKPHRYEKYINAVPGALSALKLPGIQMMSNEEFDTVANDLISFDPEKYKQSISLAMASKGVPQEAVGPLVEHQMRINTYLMNNLPPTHDSKWISDEGTPRVRTADRRVFSQKLRAAQIPATVLEDLLSGKLTKHSAEAWWATQPQMAEYMAERIRNMIDIAAAHGRTFTAKEKYLYGLMADPSAEKLGRSRDYNMTMRLQGNFQAEEQQTPAAQPGGPSAPGSPKAVAGLNSSTAGPSQGLTRRLTER